jgi:hypothetical protein
VEFLRVMIRECPAGDQGTGEEGAVGLRYVCTTCKALAEPRLALNGLGWIMLVAVLLGALGAGAFAGLWGAGGMIGVAVTIWLFGRSAICGACGAGTLVPPLTPAGEEILRQHHPAVIHQLEAAVVAADEERKRVEKVAGFLKEAEADAQKSPIDKRIEAAAVKRGKPKPCPMCNLDNPPNAQRCDCGFRFA